MNQINWICDNVLLVVLFIAMVVCVDDLRDSFVKQLEMGNYIQAQRLQLEREDSARYQAKIDGWVAPLEITRVTGKDPIKGERKQTHPLKGMGEGA